MKKLLALSVLLFVSLFSYSQITGVKYMVELDDDTGYYECKLIITEGSATDYIDLIQLNSQFTIVIPIGKEIWHDENFNPLINNETQTSTDPAEWILIKYKYSPSEQPGSSYYTFSPNVDIETSSYNNLNPGDVITLFRVGGSSFNCNLDVRPIDNNLDATLIGADDYSNGFSIGATDQVYIGNELPSTFDADFSVVENQFTNCPGECVTITPGVVCAPLELTYLWGTGETTESITVCPDVIQTYDVTVNGPQGLSASSSVTVFIEENIIGFDDVDFFCVGQSYYPYSEFEGEWSTSDESIAAFDNGELLILSEGTVTISNTSEAGCVTDMEITTSPLPVATFSGPDVICPETTTTMSPSNGGTWTSDNSNIATVTNAGVVTAVGSGTTFLTYTNSMGCSATTDIPLTVLPAPFIQNTGTEVLCVGETTLIASANDGTWQSITPEVASIDNSGLVTAVSSGEVYFTFTDTETGCTNTSGIIIVNPTPEITSGAPKICVGETTNLLPTTGGTWTSDNPSVATINNNGLATGVSPGAARFYFTDTAIGCTSNPSLPTIVENCMVNPALECSQAEIICDMDLLNNFLGSMPQEESGGNQPNQLCPDGGVANNISWIGFVAPEGDYSITVSPISCSGSTAGQEGVQIGLYTSCDFTESVFCQSSCSTNPITFDSNVLEPGQEYFFFIDGCTGTACEYAIQLTGNYISQCESPCDDASINTAWDYVPAGEFNEDYNIITYATAPNLLETGGRDHLVFYDYNTGNVYLKENNGNGFLDNEILLFNNEDHYENGTYKIYLEDIDNDGLTDLVLSESGIFNSSSIGDRLSVYQNLGSGEFVLRFNEQVCGMEGPNNLKIADFDNDGMKDIFFVCVDYLYNILWISTWDLADLSNLNSQNFCNFYAGDFNDDGNIDIGFNDQKALINNGDRTFNNETLVVYEAGCSGLTYFVEETNTILDPNFATLILDPPNLTSEFCSEHYFGDNENEIFRAYITSPDVESVIIPQIEGFHFVDPDSGCDIYNNAIQIPNAVARQNTKIDLTLNGCSDFLVIEGDQIFAWINPKQSNKILGTAFIDENENGIYDSNELPLRNILVSITPGDFSVLTGNDGNYIFSVPPGTYTITANVNEGEWIQSELTITNIQISEPCNEGYNFGFVPNSGSEEMATLSMINTIARCDFETRFTITVENTGAEPLDAVLLFNFDDQTTFFSSDIAGYQLIGNSVTANIGPLPPFSPQTYKVNVKMPSGSSNLPMLAFDAKLYDKFGGLIEEYGYSDQLRCSYDPNDKREYPDREGTNNLTLMDEDIEYTIRFQNNGNDTAFLVKIVDPLDPNIDPSTIRVMNSSHDVETCIEGTDLIFLFEDILLVDSTTNYAASQGFVTFRCNAKDGRAEMTPVHNEANIIFDTNAPIITNQTINTLVSVLCTDKETLLEASICEGETYEGHMVSGTYTESFDLPFGCDSVVTIVLDVQGITVAQNTVDICQGESIFFNGVSYELTESTELIDSLYNENGCISDIITLQINVAQITYSQENIEACAGTNVTINGNQYMIEENTSIIDTVINENGCVSDILTFEIEAISDILGMPSEIGVCNGESITILPPLDGTWTSNDESIIIIDTDGSFITVGEGSTTLTFTDNGLGCTDELPIKVYPKPEITSSGADAICINDTINVTSDVPGFWTSDEPLLVSIDNDGMVIALNSGSANLIFSANETGCSSVLLLEVLPASDPMCTVGTENLDENLVKLYPNPATESIFIETKDVWESIKIVNTQGKIVTTIPQLKMGKLEVNVAQYLSGVYLIIFQEGEKNLTKRFVVR
ncbi:MAG: putative repeat protein (TIGR01451 family) [Saprospiraceae bacterium]|jgi:uncharacterized repeat protein (TIGR01451 family)